MSRQPGANQQHVKLTLGLYVLGALSAEEYAEVDSHLLQCVECGEHYEYIRDLPRYLDLLTEDDVAALLEDGPVGDAAGSEPDHREAGRAHPVGLRPGRTGRQHSMRDVTRPNKAAPRGRIRRVGVGHFVLIGVVTMAAAFGIGTWLNPAWLERTPPAVATLAAASTDATTGVSASVMVIPGPTEMQVTATIAGLAPDDRYTLLAVSHEGGSYAVATFVGTGNSQTIAGTAPLASAQLSFFAVISSSRLVVVRVPFSLQSASALAPRPSSNLPEPDGVPLPAATVKAPAIPSTPRGGTPSFNSSGMPSMPGMPTMPSMPGMPSMP